MSGYWLQNGVKRTQRKLFTDYKEKDVRKWGEIRFVKTLGFAAENKQVE